MTDFQKKQSKPDTTKKKNDSSEFDSRDEIYFSWYLEELKQAGYINGYVRDVAGFQLSDTVKFSWIKEMKTKEKEQSYTLLHGHVYTPDFVVFWNEKARGVFFVEQGYKAEAREKCMFLAQKYNNKLCSYIEIKPSFDMQNMTRLFSVNQKWVYDKYKVFIQKITPASRDAKCWFAKTFTPKRFLTTDKSDKLRTIKFNVTTLEEFVNKEL